jgi:hypothetical protein
MKTSPKITTLKVKRFNLLNESDATVPKARKLMQSLEQEFTTGNDSTIKNRTFLVITHCSTGGKPVNSALQNRTFRVRTGQLVRLVIKEQKYSNLLINLLAVIEEV